jgi:hypothetical protein
VNWNWPENDTAHDQDKLGSEKKAEQGAGIARRIRAPHLLSRHNQLAWTSSARKPDVLHYHGETMSRYDGYCPKRNLTISYMLYFYVKWGVWPWPLHKKCTPDLAWWVLPVCLIPMIPWIHPNSLLVLHSCSSRYLLAANTCCATPNREALYKT